MILDVNKFKCFNQLYMYEMHCPQNFIKIKKFNFHDNLRDSNYWTKDQLDLINYEKNSWNHGNIFI